MLTQFPGMTAMKTSTTLLLLAAAALVPIPATSASAATTHHTCRLPAYGAGTAYRPDLHGLDLDAHVDNPWFPLRPGTTFVYTGVQDGKPAVDVVDVSRATKRIDGVRTRVVHDRLYLNGALVERTTDYYAQDRCDNVWYFGEDTADLDAHGRVESRDGTWHAGVGRGQPGVFIQARPEMQRRFRQEWSPGQAEDSYRAIRRDEGVTVPAGRFTHTLRTEETDGIEPGVVDNKLYARGVGQLVEVTVRGDDPEPLRLVDVLR